MMSTVTPTTRAIEAGGSSVRLAGSSGHNLALDGVRGLAILMVVIHHSGVLPGATSAERTYRMLSEFGAFGVDLFFVLSGFLITGILIDAKEAHRASGSSASNWKLFGNFYARRTLRIFPLYYAVLALSFLVIPRLPGIVAAVFGTDALEQIGTRIATLSEASSYSLWFWLYASNIAMAMTGQWLSNLLAVTWSLGVEEQFYIVWPFVVFWAPAKRLALVCCGTILLALICRSALVGYYTFVPPLEPSGVHPLANPIGPYVLTLCRADSLAAGALVATLLRRAVDLGAAARLARWALWMCLPIAVGLAVFEHMADLEPKGYEGIGSGPLYRSVGLTIFALASAGAVTLAALSRRGTLTNRVWEGRALRVLGKYSYGIYLLHPLCILVLRLVVFDVFKLGGPERTLPRFGGSLFPAQVAYHAAALGLSLAAAWVSWHLFEQPILKLKRYFPSGYERRPASQANA